MTSCRACTTCRPGFARGLTLVELMVAVVVTAVVAASVVTTMSAVRLGLEGQDEAARSTARIARAQARIGDHLFRARMILAQEGEFCALWVPSEEFDASPTNAAEYDAIHREELRFWSFDAAAQAVVMERTSDRGDRTQVALATDWESLRDSLAVQGALERSVVIDGVSAASFRASGFDPCSDRRISLMVELADEPSDGAYEVGGALEVLLEHPSCD